MFLNKNVGYWSIYSCTIKANSAQPYKKRDRLGQLLRHFFLILYKKVIDFSVGKWSALIKQAKKKQEEQNKNLSQSVAQCDENITKEKMPPKDGKYQIW